jgi:hypothetical protein
MTQLVSSRAHTLHRSILDMKPVDCVSRDAQSRLKALTYVTDRPTTFQVFKNLHVVLIECPQPQDCRDRVIVRAI